MGPEKREDDVKETHRKELYNTWISFGLSALLTACSVDSKEATNGQIEPSELCLGGSEVWIGYQNFVGMGNGGFGERMNEENGYEFFIIDGSCRFVALNPPSGWATKSGLWDVVEGKLSAEEAAKIANQLEIQTWGDFTGKYFSANVEDCGGAQLFSGDGAFGCVCGCPDFDGVASVFKSAGDTLTSLAQRGTPVGGLLRIMARPFKDQCPLHNTSMPDGDLIFDVPEGFNLPGISAQECATVGPGFSTGENSSLVEGEAAEAFRSVRRALRDRILDGGGGVYENRLAFSAEGKVYEVWLRDYVPYEDDEGLINPHHNEGFAYVNP